MYRFLAKRLRDVSRRDMRTSALITAILITALGILMNYIYVNTVEQQRQRDYVLTQQTELKNTKAYILNKFASYRQVLLAGTTTANIKGPDSLTRDDWQRYYTTMRINQNYPGILGLGYARYIPEGEIQAVTDSIHEEGFPEFRIHPEDTRDEYTSITFIEPFNAVNKTAFGYDMFSEPKRKEAMERARDTADFAITAPVKLRQDIYTPNEVNNVLLYFPVYSTYPAPNTVDERRDALQGYVYLALQAEGIMKAMEQQHASSKIAFTLEDVTNGETKHIYSSSPKTSTEGPSISGTIQIGMRTWKMTMHVPRNDEDDGIKSLLLFVTGIASSILLGSIIYTFLRKRITRIHAKHEDELQSTKDELLALASHQLRTPASGVRQYLSMLQHGYFGELSSEQKTITEKAYRANDRQLEIIDQLLYVAKADAGQLILQPESFNLSAILHDIADGMEASANNKNISVKISAPKNIPLLADERFIRMIIENLLSNALKYSYAGSTVRVNLTKNSQHIKLTFRDKGVGISETDRDLLFKKFSRIQNPLSTKEGGSGLGLYLAQRLAEAHGGIIEVETTPDTGSTFTLLLPRKVDYQDSVIQLTE